MERMQENVRQGICPRCGASGLVADPCNHDSCLGESLHYIPESYARARVWRPGSTVNRQVGRRWGDYLLVQTLGRGGFGTVFHALQLPTLSPAALKLIHRKPDVKNPEPLLREAMSLAKLDHPNIVRLLDYKSEGGLHYLVTEYIPGGRHLRDELEQIEHGSRTLSVREIQSILIQVLNALACAHRHQIIHRDVKPENIMLQELDGSPLRVRVLDFGLAKFLWAGQRSSTTVGSPAYMAPEQLLPLGHIGSWTDLYALGIVSFELLTGHLPFDGRTLREMVAREMNPHSDPFKDVPDCGLPLPVRKFMRKAVAYSPSERFGSAIEFRDALSRSIDCWLGRPTSASIQPGGSRADCRQKRWTLPYGLPPWSYSPGPSTTN